jgi:hypothetical protein
LSDLRGYRVITHADGTLIATSRSGDLRQPGERIILRGRTERELIAQRAGRYADELETLRDALSAAGWIPPT